MVSRRQLLSGPRRGGALAALIRLRLAKKRIRQGVPRPARIKPCLIGDGNGNLISAWNPTTGLPSDHRWVRDLTEGGRITVARNPSRHVWKEGDRVQCEALGSEVGEILTILYRERSVATVLYAHVYAPALAGGVGGQHILKITPGVAPNGSDVTYESLGYPAGIGFFSADDFVARDGALYLARLGDTGAGTVWAYTRAGGWTDVGLPLSGPMPGQSGRNAAHLMVHDGAAHAVILFDGALESFWRVYRLQGATATLRGQVNHAGLFDPLTGFSVNDRGMYFVSAGSATPDGPGPIYACVQDLSNTDTIFVRQILSPQDGTLVVSTDQPLTGYTHEQINFSPTDVTIHDWLVSGGKFNVSRGIGDVIAATVTTDGSGTAGDWQARFGDMDSSFGGVSTSGYRVAIWERTDGESELYWTVSGTTTIPFVAPHAPIHYSPPPPDEDIVIHYLGRLIGVDADLELLVSINPISSRSDGFTVPRVVNDLVWVGVSVQFLAEASLQPLPPGLFIHQPSGAFTRVQGMTMPRLDEIIGVNNSGLFSLWTGEAI